MDGAAVKRLRAFGGRKKLQVLVLATRFKLALNNATTRQRVIEPGGVIVSLTSYGDRLQSCHVAIESIAQGQTKPGRLILWVSETDLQHALTQPLKRLVRRGLEIRPTQNLGPHTKYYPALAISADSSSPLVTADDDIMYPKQWLRKLVEAHNLCASEIACHRARVMKFDANSHHLSSYSSWPYASSNDSKDQLLFITGVSGVLYPVSMVEALIERGTSFLENCPTADDIWVSHTAQMNNIAVTVVNDRSRDFLPIETNQSKGLKFENVNNDGNDRQINRTYSLHDIELLWNSLQNRRRAILRE